MTSTIPSAPSARGQGFRWEASFRRWRPGAGDRFLRSYSDAVNRRLLERWLPARSGRVLKTDLFDEAVGTGLVGLLLERADHVTGIDVASSVVAAARSAQPLLEADVADVRALPYEDATFDTVVSNSTLDHFDSRAGIELALAELSRVLRPGGLLIISLDNPCNPLVALRNALPHELLRRTGLVPYATGTTCGPRELARLVEAAGLEVEGSETIMHVPRLAVRAAGARLADDEARGERLLQRLLAAEPPRRLPLSRRSGQFFAVRARRAVDRDPATGLAGEPVGAPTPGPLRVFTMRALGRTVYRRLVWLELALPAPARDSAARVPLTLGFLDEADASEIAACRPGLGVADVLARFARGDRCHGARHEGRLVAVGWVAAGTARIDYLGMAVSLPPRTVYRYDVWTDPALRGLRIPFAAGSHLNRTLHEEGYDTVTAAILEENRPALHIAQRSGFRRAGVVGWVGAGPLRRRFRRIAA